MPQAPTVQRNGFSLGPHHHHQKEERENWINQQVQGYVANGHPLNLLGLYSASSRVHRLSDTTKAMHGVF